MSGAAGTAKLLGGMIAGAVLGFGTDIALQLEQGKTIEEIDFIGAGASGFAGAVGAATGVAVAKRISLTTPVIGESLEKLSRFQVRSDEIISAAIGGISGAILDAAGKEILRECFAE